MKRTLGTFFNFFPAFILGALVVQSCKQSSSPNGSNGTAFVDSGIGGTVLLVDTNGKLLPSFIGVTVTLDSPHVSTTTDAQGRWVIRNLGLGTWHITFTRPGFGSTWQEADKSSDLFPPPPGAANWFETVQTQALGLIPTQKLVLDSVQLGWDRGRNDSIAQPYYHVNTPNPFQQVPTSGILYFVSNDSTFSVSGSNFFEQPSYSFGGLPGFGSELFPAHPNSGNEPGAGLTPGTKAYVVVCEIPNQVKAPSPNDLGPSAYWDPATQRNIFSACGPRSNVVSFIVP